MKKPKMLVATLAVAVMVMGAGYAYWNQTLTINNTVATGNLDVQFVSGATVDGFDNVTPSDRVIVSAPKIATGGQSMTFTVGNLYPGAGASLHFVIKNTGKVDAKVSGVSATNIVDPDLANILEYQVDTAVVTTYSGSHKTEVNIGIVNAESPVALAAALSKNDILKNITLKPGDTLQLINNESWGFHLQTSTQTPGYDVMMPTRITGSDFENRTTTFDLGITFTQSNAQPGDSGSGTP